LSGWTGKRVTVMGLGLHGGALGAVRFLARRGARVTVTDAADERSLQPSLDSLSDVNIERYRLGGHDEADFSNADVVVVNPAVRPEHPLIDVARRAGAEITTELGLLLDACPSRVIGVTGTVGKSSTATMIAGIFEAAGQRTWLGGNLGGSLLDRVDEMQSDDVVVLEMSSFQLHWLPASVRWPAMAVVTNCQPNHLDWHGTMAHYAAAKRRLLENLPEHGVAVFDKHGPIVGDWMETTRRKTVSPAPDIELPNLSVEGRHQRSNAALAAAAAAAWGCDLDAISAGLRNFRGLPHRLQFVANVQGRRFINDSKSTTPVAAIAALQNYAPDVWLIAGGRAKAADHSTLAAAIGTHSRGAAFFGESADAMFRCTRERAPSFDADRFTSLREAFDWCWQRSRSGDAILLSPACASFDQYRDFAHRGEHFVELVDELKRSCEE
jgi:UDP-N-acetylmuramoylalanine--D-glutamate ligase